MDTLLQTDIFFFITTIAIVVITITTVIAIFFLIQILRDVRHVSMRAREQSDRILADVEGLRNFIKEESKKAIDIKELASGVLQVFRGRKRTRKTVSKKGA